jgi:hypothetical protein
MLKYQLLMMSAEVSSSAECYNSFATHKIQHRLIIYTPSDTPWAQKTSTTVMLLFEVM